ncbi:hypothetical protein ACFLT4_02305 [Chloroflexota bacterium]
MKLKDINDGESRRGEAHNYYRALKRGVVPLTKTLPLSFEGEGDTVGEVDNNKQYWHEGDLDDKRLDNAEQDLPAI